MSRLNARLLLAALCIAAPAAAEDLQSPSHRFSPTAVGSGGGTASSAGGSLLLTIGEPAAGVSASASHQFRGGFAHLLRGSSPREALEDLLALLEALGLDSSFTSLVDNALSQLAKGNTTPATQQLNALRSKIAAQSGKKLPAATAASLDALLAQAIALIGSYTTSSGLLAAGPSATGAFRLGEHFCFPNPARGVDPTLHLDAGSADAVTARIYDLSGATLAEFELEATVVGGKAVFEGKWEAKAQGSGVYVYGLTASKEGANDLKAIGKCALLK
jgi:hypothetical protein